MLFNEKSLVCVTPPKADFGSFQNNEIIVKAAFENNDVTDNSVSFKYYNQPKISEIYPNSIQVNKAYKIFIKAESGFVKSCNPMCRFGNTLSKAKFVNSTCYECETPIFKCSDVINFAFSLNGVEFPNQNLYINVYEKIFFANFEPYKIINNGNQEISIIGRGFNSTDSKRIHQKYYCNFTLKANGISIGNNKFKK